MSETIIDGPDMAKGSSMWANPSAAPEPDGGAATMAVPPAPDLSSRALQRRRRAVQGIALGFSLLVAVCLSAGILAWQSGETARTVIRTLSARQATDQAMEQILIAESAQRGFLLTHNERFMPAYRTGVVAFSVAAGSLERTAQGNPDLARLATEFVRQAGMKFAELDQTIALAEADQYPQALALVQSGLGERTMTEVRETMRRIIDNLNQTIQHNAPWQVLLPKMLLLTTGLAAICVIVLSVVVLRDTRRNLKFLASRETALRQLAATLESRVQRRTRSLTQVNQRFDAALRAARVTVFTQDSDLKFTWISSADPSIPPEALLGRDNSAVVPNDTIESVVRIKQSVLDTGQPGRGEVRLALPGGDKWFDLSVHPLRDSDDRVVGLIGGSVEVTERKEQEARIRLLMREVTHRSKNLLSVIQAIMRQTAAHSLSIDDFQKRFADRLYSLAGSHDLLVQENWNGAALRELIRSQLGHYSDLVGSQIALSGPAMQLRPDAAQHIGMALHELATNAAKYGALSVPDGRVAISWSLPADDDVAARCTLQWVESNGPPVVPPARRGFGRVVIERTVARALDGTVEMDYPPEGARWKLSFPIAAVV